MSFNITADSFSEITTFLANRPFAKLQFVERTKVILLVAFDTNFTLNYVLSKTANDPSELALFNSTYRLQGNKELQNLSFASERLKVESTIAPGSSSDAPGNGVYTNKLRVVWYNGDPDHGIPIPLPDISSPMYNVYTYLGHGKLDSFIVRFNSDDIMVKLEIDNEIIFHIGCEFLEHINRSDNNVTQNGLLSWNDRDDKSLVFKPKSPVLYNSSIKIFASAGSSSSQRKMEGYMVSLTKEPII